MMREVSISRAPGSATAAPRRRRPTARGGTGSRSRCPAPWRRRSGRHARRARPSSPGRPWPGSCWRSRRSPPRAGRHPRRGLDQVPAELRHAHALGEAADALGDDAQAGDAGALLAGLRTAAGGRRRCRSSAGRRAIRLAQGRVEPALDQPGHRGAERADAGQHDVRGGRDLLPGSRPPAARRRGDGRRPAPRRGWRCRWGRSGPQAWSSAGVGTRRRRRSRRGISEMPSSLSSIVPSS